MSYEELVEVASKHGWALSEQMKEWIKYPIIIDRAEGVLLKDVRGKEYIDWFSGESIGAPLGHGNKRVLEAIHKQLDQYQMFFLGLSRASIALAKKLSEILPNGCQRPFIVNSGSEAVETSLKMIRQYFRILGKGTKQMFVGRWTGYHGASYGALAVGGSPQRIKFEPVLPGVEHVFPPYCYRCPYCEKDGECNLLCARIIEEVVKCRGAENIAAFISEPVSLLCPDTPPEYWSIVKEICEENDILLMIDEIMTGFGRTGKLFAVENWNLIPDIMTIGKGMSSGYLPLSASCAKPEITESFWGELEEGRTFEHAFGWSTHNAISCAAANACIDVIERERIAEKTADKGRYMIKRLKELEEIPIVGEVRGRYGMMASLELVTDKDSKKIPPPERMKVVAKQIQRMFWENGLAEWFHGNIVPLMPPLSISIEEIDRSFHIMDTVLREVNEKKLMSS